MQTDFKLLDGIIPYQNADFGDLFQLVEMERQIISSGAEIMAYEHSRIRQILINTIAANWGKFASGRHGDRGGFHGHFEKDIEGIARAVMRPLDEVYKHLADAQWQAAKFKPVFERWMEPISRPGPTKQTFGTSRGSW